MTKEDQIRKDTEIEKKTRKDGKIFLSKIGKLKKREIEIIVLKKERKN